MYSCTSGEGINKLSTTKPLKNTRIVECDTIHIYKIKYTLHGINAPEIKQLCKIMEISYKCGVKSKGLSLSYWRQTSEMFSQRL